MPEQAPAVLGGTAIKPVERHGWEKIKWFFWDPKRGAIMGRTPKSWGLITLFYIIFYACLAAFWALMLTIFFLFINENTPKYMGEESLIGKSPGVGLRPSQPDETLDSSMFIFNVDQKYLDEEREIPGYDTWAEKINEFLESYQTSKNGPCSPNTPGSPANPYPCHFDTNVLKKCGGNKENSDYFGYRTGTPCVYLKLNKLMGVQNIHYTDMSNATKNLPPDFPEELKAHVNRQRDKEQVWITCEGENPADMEAAGEMEYFPKAQGFPGYYFPYNGQNKTHKYESPIVAVKFNNPTRGQLIHIECRAWAENIMYSRMDRRGMVRFELFIMDDNYASVYGTEESWKDK